MELQVNKFIKNTERKFPSQGRYGFYRYDMNENPSGLPKEFVEEVLKEITPEFLSIYPEPDKFLNKYAKFLGNGVKYENVLATNGSDMGIRYLLETFGEVGKDVVTVSPSFEMYAVNCWILGLNHKPVKYEKDLTIDINKIINAITNDTRVVVLLNPNNPVGNVYSEEDVKLIIDKAESINALVIIDEAYHYFYDKTFLDFALNRKNVVILRTFSKLMSIAACRIGVMIGSEDIIHYVKNSKLTFDVNSIALLFAEKIIERPDLIQNLIDTERKGRDYTLEVLRKNNYWCKDCKGNFIFVKPNHNAQEITRKLEKDKKVLVHAYGNELLKDYIRVSTGSIEDMKIFIDAFLEIDKN